MVDLTNLDPSAAALMKALSGYGLSPISGFRDPGYNARVGGARGSQHMGGRALDYKLDGLDDATKAKFLQSAVDAGAKGIGIYPGGSIHVDTRESDPAFWGPGGSYRSTPINQAPEWAQPVLGRVFPGGASAAAPPAVDPFGVGQAKSAGVLPATKGVTLASSGAQPLLPPAPGEKPSPLDVPVAPASPPPTDLTAGTAAAAPKPSEPLVDPNSTLGKTINTLGSDKVTGVLGGILKANKDASDKAYAAATQISPSSIGNDGQAAAIANSASQMLAADAMKRKRMGLSLGGMA